MTASWHCCHQKASIYNGFTSISTGGKIIGIAATEKELAGKATRFLKAEMKRSGVTYAHLAERIKEHGFSEETEASISSKLARGTFAATFFLAALAALKITGVQLDEL